jgi:membrane protein DedA with SNARE-associated domain
MFAAYVAPFVREHGYWAVFLIVMLESAGLPLPGETALVLAAIFAGVTGELDILWIVGLAALAAIVGDNLGFWAGRRYGLPLLVRYGHYVHLTPPRLKLAQYMFRLHGGKIVFFGRFIAVLRVFAALLAGANRYAWPPFLAYNAAGGILWAAMFGGGGFLFGEVVHRVAGPVAMVILALVLIGGMVFWLVARRQEERWIAAAEAAIPGPLEERPRRDPAREKLVA